MPRKRFSAEQIVVLLRQIEVLMSQGKTPPVACREAGISQQSYYRWRKDYGGLEVDQAKRMKELDKDFSAVVAEINLETLPFAVGSKIVHPAPTHIAKFDLHEDADRRAFFLD